MNCSIEFENEPEEDTKWLEDKLKEVTRERDEALSALAETRKSLRFEQDLYSRKCEDVGELRGKMIRLESENRFLRRILELVITTTNIESKNDDLMGV